MSVAHLVCTKHERRVMVLDPGHTRHRNDGTKCGGVLRINGRLTRPTDVINYGKRAGVRIGTMTYGG